MKIKMMGMVRYSASTGTHLIGECSWFIGGMKWSKLGREIEKEGKDIIN